MAEFKQKYINELSKCRDPGRQLELIIAINKNGLLYEDVNIDIKKFYNLPIIDEGIDVIVLQNGIISEVYQCKNTTKMIVGAHELGTFFNLYLHILIKHLNAKLDHNNIPRKFVVGNLNTKFRDTIDDIIRIDVEEELKKYLPNNLNHIRELILYNFGGDFGYLHSMPKNSIQRKEYQIRVNEWFSGLSKIFKPVVKDEDLFNETRDDEFVEMMCNKIIELKKIFETNPLFENDFTQEHNLKHWLIKLRKTIIEMNYMKITLPMSNCSYLLNINSKYNTRDFINSNKSFEICGEYNQTNKIKINYGCLYLYLPKDEDIDFYYDDEKSKIACEYKKKYWLINGWF